MGKIYCMMGKSATGKDTLFKMLLEDQQLSLKTIVPYTTRPMRAGERDGVEYFFCDEQTLSGFNQQGRIIELRAYDTVHGSWKYFTVNDTQIDLETQDYLMIGTLQSYLSIREYYGMERVSPIYIEVDDGVRLQRALDRERSQDMPQYEEMCRRFLADAKDFSEEKLMSARINRRFVNLKLDETKQNIKSFILNRNTEKY